MSDLLLSETDSDAISDLLFEVRTRLARSAATDAFAAADEFTTMPQRMLMRLCVEPDAVAFRQKHRGYYREWSWKTLALEVARLHSALRDLGFRRGCRLALIGDPCIELLALEMAAMAAGGISVNLYPSHSVEEMQKLLADVSPSIIVADRQDQLVKAINAMAALPGVRSVILLDGKIKFMYPQANVLEYESLREAGRRLYAAGSAAFVDSIADGQPDDAAMLFFTDFSIERPKVVVHSHKTFQVSLKALQALCPVLLTQPLAAIAIVPAAHIIGKLTVLLPFFSRLVVYFSEDVENPRAVLHEVSPSYAILPPRIFQKLASDMVSDLQATTGLKRLAYRCAFAVASRVQSGRAGPTTRFAALLARLLVFRPLLDRAGLGRLRYAAVGGAAASHDVVSLWRMWGLDLRVVYLQAECGVVLGQQRFGGDPRSLGSPIRDSAVELQVSGGRELLVRSQGLPSGYWHGGAVRGRPVDEWHRTGDLVAVVGGEFHLIGRNSRIALANGRGIDPDRIAELLKGSAFISHAVVIGESRRAIGALLELDGDVTARWARSRNIPYTSYANLVQNPLVREKIAAEIDLVNRRLEDFERISGFRAIPVQLDPELGLVTPSRAVVRRKVEEFFGSLIADIYRDIDAQPSVAEGL